MGRLGRLILVVTPALLLLVTAGVLATDNHLAGHLRQAEILLHDSPDAGEASEALALLVEVQAARPGDARVLLGIARAHHGLGQPERAFQALAEAFRAARSDEMREEIRETTLEVFQEDVKAREEALHRTSPTDPEGVMTDQEEWPLGEVTAARYALAREVLPDTTEAHLSIGNILLTTGVHREAEPHLSTVVTREPEKAIALNNLAWLYLTAPDTDLRRPAEALPLARRAVDLSPKTASHLHTLAEACAQNGLWEEAASWIGKAQGLEVRDARFARMLAYDLARFQRREGRDPASPEKDR